jgi:hypothetical protein
VYLEALLAGFSEDLWCGGEEDAPQPVQVLTRQLNRGVRHAHRQQPPGRVVLKKVIRTCQRNFILPIGKIEEKAVLWILIGFNADPDPAFYLNLDPDPDPGSQTNTDPGGSGYENTEEKKLSCEIKFYKNSRSKIAREVELYKGNMCRYVTAPVSHYRYTFCGNCRYEKIIFPQKIPLS